VRVDEERPDGIALILRAIDLTIADVEARDTRERDEQLATLRFMRQRWSEKAKEEGGGA
jgi:hypothetical protein